jgi:hypothetical protein
MINNLDILLPEETEELYRLVLLYSDSRERKKYKLSDLYRHYITRYGGSIDLHGNCYWNPIFEQNSHRLHRIRNRVIKYGVPIYPFNRDKKGYLLNVDQCIIYIDKALCKIAH